MPGEPRQPSGSAKRMVSGIQPTGGLHLGNYIGALGYWVEQQAAFDNIVFVADLHALTVPEEVDPRAFRRRVIDTVCLYFAAGIDPERSLVFLQSDVPQHCELGWILTCCTPLGWLERMTQYKSRAGRLDSIGAGLLTYPTLQAADILLYEPDYVPVGEDQKQHVELTRDIAQRFNGLFGPTLRLPEPLMRPHGARIMGLDDPGEKMSKSIAASRPGHAIFLLDGPDVVRDKIRTATTDLKNDTTFAGASAGVRNLLVMLGVLRGLSMDETEQLTAGRGYKFLKEQVVDAVNDVLAPVRKAFDEHQRNLDWVHARLRVNRERAMAIAGGTLHKVRQAIGLTGPSTSSRFACSASGTPPGLAGEGER